MAHWAGKLKAYAELASRRVFIYGLVDPRTGAVRYVGKANDINKRYQGHLRDARRRRTPVYSWIRKLSEAGLTPGLLLLESCNGATWKNAERRLIAEYRTKGKMLNVAEGGDEPHCPSHVRAENGRKVARARFERLAMIDLDELRQNSDK